MKHTNNKPKNRDIRADGKVFDGHTWRKTGINHHCNEEGLIFYKREFRTLKGYLQQGGHLSKIVFGNVKTPQAITTLTKVLYDKENSGDVYIITNKAWKGWVKIGRAIDAEDRCKGYQTSSPFRDYTLEYKRYFKDRTKAEKDAHKLCTNKAEDRNGEWFKMSIQEAKKLIETISEKQYEKETA